MLTSLTLIFGKKPTLHCLIYNIFLRFSCSLLLSVCLSAVLQSCSHSLCFWPRSHPLLSLLLPLSPSFSATVVQLQHLKSLTLWLRQGYERLTFSTFFSFSHLLFFFRFIFHFILFLLILRWYLFHFCEIKLLTKCLTKCLPSSCCLKVFLWLWKLQMIANVE